MSKFISGMIFGGMLVACFMGFKDTYNPDLGYSLAGVSVIVMGIIWMAIKAQQDDEDDKGV